MSGKKGKAVLERIGKASRGLVYISETDSEVEAVRGGRAESIDRSSLRSAFQLDDQVRIEPTDSEELFERLTRNREWHTERDRANAAGFARLKAVLEEELTEMKVFRVGDVRLDIYIVGLERGGRIAGVRMHAVET